MTLKKIVIETTCSIKTFFMLSLALFTSCGSPTQAQLKESNELKQTNVRFEQLKEALFTQPYTQLPQYKVTRKLFGPAGNSDKNKVLSAARRTFKSTADLIEQTNGQKLLNANGICFSGTWHITNANPYSGLYKKGTISPAIIRASVALSGTKQKNKRAFGMAIKLLPHDLGDAPSLNAFILHSMGGTITKHVLNLSMDNEPPLGRLPRFRDLRTALRLRNDLEQADSEFSSGKPDASFRPVSSFALYKQNVETVHSPKWLRLTPITKERINKNDFRDELHVKNYTNNRIAYRIEVAGDNSSLNDNKKNIQWLDIGIVYLTESVTSSVCDLNLHFQHPRINETGNSKK